MIRKTWIIILLITTLSYGQDTTNFFRLGICIGGGEAINPKKFDYVKDFGVYFEHYYKNDWLTGGGLNYTFLPISLDDSTDAMLEYFKLFPSVGKDFLKKKLSLGIGPQMWFLNRANAYVNNEIDNHLDSVRVFKDIWYRTVYGFKIFVRYNIKISNHFDGCLGAFMDYSVTTPKDPIFWPLEWDIYNIGSMGLNFGINYKLH